MSFDNLLQDLVDQAIHLGGCRLKLKGGLIIEMRLVNSVLLNLILSRVDGPPSITEWQTIIKYFPWPVSVKPNFLGNTIHVSLAIHPKYLQSSLPYQEHLC